MLPVIITNRNYFRFLVRMVEQLAKFPNLDLHIIDAESSWEPLLAWYKSQSLATVHHIGHNNSIHRAAWNCGYVDRLAPEGGYYAVTDPDLDFSGVPSDFLGRLLVGLDSNPGAIKCGPSLRIDDLDGYPLADWVRTCETQYWDKRLLTPCGEFYRANIDTTFAVYRTGTVSRRSNEPALRCAAPYSVRHLPWYLSAGTLEAEDRWRIERSATGYTGGKLLEVLGVKK